MKKLLLLTTLTTSITFSSFAYAQNNPNDSYYYAGISASNPNSKDQDDLATKDEKSSTYKLFGGYSINQNFAIEGHYADKLTDISDNQGDNYKTKSYGVSAIYKIPLDGFTPFAKLGYHRWKFTETEVGNPVVNTTGKDLFYGLGTSIALNDKIDFKIEAEKFNYENSAQEKITTKLYSVGVAYKF